MLINRKLALTAAVALTLGATSCRKFMSVNTNPNVSQTATVKTLLPGAQLYIGSAVGMDLELTGSIWSQYWTQTPIASQYVVWEQYAPGQEQFNYAWSNLYQGAENFRQLYKLADTLHKKQYKAVALLMQAYTFQLITDAWGDVPYRDALLGEYSAGHKVNPKYDSQRVVYNGILALIDSANKFINIADPSAPGAEDLVYSGDMSKWQKFSNTLKLRVLLRQINIDPTGVKKKLDSLFAHNPQFIGTGDDAKIAYGSSSANKNPLYAEESSTQLAGVQNLGGSATCIDSMNSNGDPRAVIFYEPGNGITQGSFNITLPAGSYAIPNIYVAGDAQNDASKSAPVNLLTAAESFFLQAEAAARGWGAPGADDQALFYSGIQASFDYYSAALQTEYTPTLSSAYDDYIAAGGYWSIYPAAGTAAEKVRHIITQKWFAMCGNQGFEAWTEWRRTGYPDFLIHPKSSLIGNQMPQRFLYPNTESTTNSNFPGLASITNKVWWQKP